MKRNKSKLKTRCEKAISRQQEKKKSSVIRMLAIRKTLNRTLIGGVSLHGVL
jgi:hypothetical protein